MPLVSSLHSNMRSKTRLHAKTGTSTRIDPTPDFTQKLRENDLRLMQT